MNPQISAACILFMLMTSFAAPQEPSKASIEGTVVDVGTGKPIPNARVTLTPSVLPVARTDRFGKYAFVALEPGSYRIGVAAEGYARQEYGQTVPGGFQGQGTAIALAPGQALKDVLVRLTPTGTVTGHIRDSSGQPSAGVQVQLVSPVYGPGGERRLMTAGAGRTNDRGEYRVYWVTPGRYYVVAGSIDVLGGSLQSMESGGLGGSPNEYQGAGYGITFHPGVSDPNDAVFVTVQPGVEVKLDLVVPLQRYRIRGRVVDARTGQRPANAQVTFQGRRLLEGAGGSVMMRTIPVYDAASGTFEIRDVPPGLFYISANLQEPNVANGGASRPVPVAVSGSDVDGVLVTLEPFVSIPGTMRIEGEELPSPVLNRLRVFLNLSADGRRLTDTSYGAIGGARPPDSDGRFIVSNVMPGEYRLFVLQQPDYYIKEARYNGSDALNGPLLVSSSPGTLNILLSPKVGQITGTVVDARLQPARGRQVVLIPERRDRQELYKTAVTDDAGRFTLTGITPGDYKLFAWETLEQYAYYDPKVLERFEQQGKPVHVAELSTEIVEIRMIPAP